MTQPPQPPQPQQPELSPEQLAQLQHQLDDANAQVARVQAQLSAAGTPPPATITVNGQPIPTGAGHHVTTIVDALRAAHAGTRDAAPVVLVNGRQVGTAQPFALSDLLDPAQLAQVQSALGQLAQTHPEYAQGFQGLTALAGGGGGGGWSTAGVPGAAAPGSPSAATVAPLADPPRHVPVAYRWATLNLSGLELFALVIGATGPIALWIMVPGAGVLGLLLASVLVIAYRVHLYVGRIGMLRWGKVATVTGVELLGRGSYYGGTTYQNMRMRQAHGWHADTQFYSGPGYRNKISYELDGTRGDFVLHGRDYEQGVVLVHSRKPSRAMCVSAFPYSVEPTPDGQWPGRLTAWLWGGIVATVVIELTLLYVTAVVVWRAWLG